MARTYRVVALLISIQSLLLLGNSDTATASAPQFTSQPSNVTAAQGASVTLACVAAGNPTPSIVWYRNTLPLTLNSINRQQLSDGSLHITNIQNSDEGRYHCVATNDVGSIQSFTATLQLAYLNSPLGSTALQTQLVVNLEPAVLSCEIPDSVPRPQVTWTFSTARDGGRLTYSPLSGKLIFSSWNRDSDTNTYQCTVSNSLLGSSVSSSQYLTQPAAGTSQIYQATEFVIRPQSSLTVVEGETAIFECFTTGRPTASISWTKDGQALSGSDSRISFSQFNRVLNISSAVPSDTGTYNCTASQTASQGGTYTIFTTGQLTVLELPRITSAFQATDTNLGQPVSLDCQASGTQPFEWTWRKDGVPLTPQGSISFTTSGAQSTLTISTVTENDQGVYQCVVRQTSSGREAASGNLLNPLAIRPELTQGNSLTDQLVLIGSQVLLPCTASGAPTPTFTWTKAGQSQPINFNDETVADRYTLGPGDGNFTISSAQLTDSATLTCEAVNSAGTDSATVQLRVIEPPTVTMAPSGQHVITPGDSLSLNCAVSHNVPDIRISYRWTRDGEVHSSNQNISLTANGQINGLYTCSVELGARSISGAQPILWQVGSSVVTVGDPPEPPSAPTSPTASSVTSLTFLASWIAPLFDGRLTLQNYTIETQRLGSDNCPSSGTYEVALEGISASTNSATIRSLHPFSTYTFRVIAFNSVFRSAPSLASQQFQTPEAAPQDVPSSLQVTRGDRDGELRVDWSPIADCVHHGGLITSYIVQYKISTDVSFTTREVDASTLSHLLTGLQLTTSYQVRVAARTSSGVGPFTAVEEFTTAASTSPPAEPPTQFSVSVINSTSVRLMWSPPNNTNPNDITGYSLFYKTSVGQVISVDIYIGPEERSAVITGLQSGRMYTFRVAANNTFGAGTPANFTLTLPGGEEELAFYEQWWFYVAAAVGGVLVIAIFIIQILVCICCCCKCAKSDGKYYMTSRRTTSSLSSGGFSEYHNKHHNRSHTEMIHIHSSPTPSRRSTDYADIGPGRFPPAGVTVYPRTLETMMNGHVGRQQHHAGSAQNMYPHDMQHVSHDSHMGIRDQFSANEHDHPRGNRMQQHPNEQGYPHHHGDIPQRDDFQRHYPAHGYSPQTRNVQGQFYPNEQEFTPPQDMQYPQHQDHHMNTGQFSSRFVDTMTRVHTPPNPHNEYPHNQGGLDYPPSQSSRNLSQSTDESWNPSDNLNYRGHMSNNPVSRSSSFKSTVSTTSFERGPLPNMSNDPRTRGHGNPLSPLPENQFFEQSPPVHPQHMNGTSMQDLHQIKNRSRSMGQQINRIDNRNLRDRAQSFDGMIDTPMELGQSNLDIQQRALPPIPTSGMGLGLKNSVNSIPNPHSIEYTLDPKVQLSHSQFVSHGPTRKPQQQYPSAQQFPPAEKQRGSHTHKQTQRQQLTSPPQVALPPPPPFIDGDLSSLPSTRPGGNLPPPPLAQMGSQKSKLPPPPASGHLHQHHHPLSSHHPGVAQSMTQLQHHHGDQQSSFNDHHHHQRQQSLPDDQDTTSSQQPWVRKGRKKQMEHVMPQAIPPNFTNQSTPDLSSFVSEQNGHSSGDTPSGFRRIPMNGGGHVLSQKNVENDFSQDSAAAWEQVDHIQKQFELDMQNMLTPRVMDGGENFQFHDDFSSPNLNDSINSASSSFSSHTPSMVSPIANITKQPPLYGFPMTLSQAPPPVKAKPAVKPKPGSQVNGFSQNSLALNKKRPSVPDLEHLTNNDPKKPQLKRGKVPRAVWVQTSKNRAIESSSESDSDSDLSVDTVVACPGDTDSLKSSHV